MEKNSHPTLFHPSFFLTILPPSPLSSSHLAASGPPSFSCCPPLILCCLFDFKQFPSNSCFQLRGRAVDILQAFCSGQGLASAQGWWLVQDRLQGNNFCISPWLRPERAGLHLALMLPLLFLLVNKRLVILLHWKYLFALTKRWAPLRHPSVGQSHGRDTDIQTWHNDLHSSG